MSSLHTIEVLEGRRHSCKFNASVDFEFCIFSWSSTFIFEVFAYSIYFTKIWICVCFMNFNIYVLIWGKNPDFDSRNHTLQFEFVGNQELILIEIWQKKDINRDFVCSHALKHSCVQKQRLFSSNSHHDTNVLTKKKLHQWHIGTSPLIID